MNIYVLTEKQTSPGIVAIDHILICEVLTQYTFFLISLRAMQTFISFRIRQGDALQYSLLIRNGEALARGSKTTYVPTGVARLNSSSISHSLVISRMVIYFLNDNAGPESLLLHWLKNYNVYLAVTLGFNPSGTFPGETYLQSELCNSQRVQQSKELPSLCFFILEA